MFTEKKTSWHRVAGWYGKKVGKEGHFYHQSSILPEVSKLIIGSKARSILDLACGQGVLERSISPDVSYVGVDIAAGLISQAQRQKKNRLSEFFVADASKPLKIERKFDLVTCILALQNIENYTGFFDNVAQFCSKNGEVVLVINHPYYRIPRYSGWDISAGNARQYRWVTNYLSEQKIPITMNPGDQKSEVTWSFHVPLSAYINELSARGFSLKNMQEIASPKESQGKFAKRENTARAEIPLFMILTFVKNLP